MLHPSRSRLTALLIFLIALLSLWAALAGVLHESLYREVVESGALPERLVAGSQAQDYISIFAAVVLALLSVGFIRNEGYRLFIVMLGLTGYLFYAYGLYTMQGQYTDLYLLYLVIFGLALWSLIWGLISFEPNTVKRVVLSRNLRRLIAGFLLLILVVLVPLWISLMLGDIAAHRPSDTYAVFVLDLAIVFPGLAIIAALLLRNRPFGNILAGIGLLRP